MGTLYLVRHGQASFGADEYDLLSPLGHRQSVRLGEYFKQKSLVFEAAFSGTLKRQVQTLAGICEGMGAEVRTTQWPGLNEYDSAAVIQALYSGPLEKADTPERYRQYFRLLKDGLAQWMAGVVSPRGMPSYNEFVAGVVSALEHVRTHHEGPVLLVSSGGPIATAVGQVLGTSAETTIELNLSIRNASVTEFSFSPRRHKLVTYNTLPHLDTPEYASWITYA